MIDFSLTRSLSESLVRANAHLKEKEGLVGRSVYICTYISTIIILLLLLLLLLLLKCSSTHLSEQKARFGETLIVLQYACNIGLLS